MSTSSFRFLSPRDYIKQLPIIHKNEPTLGLENQIAQAIMDLMNEAKFPKNTVELFHCISLHVRQQSNWDHPLLIITFHGPQDPSPYQYGYFIEGEGKNRILTRQPQWDSK